MPLRRSKGNGISKHTEALLALVVLSEARPSTPRGKTRRALYLAVLRDARTLFQIALPNREAKALIEWDVRRSLFDVPKGHPCGTHTDDLRSLLKRARSQPYPIKIVAVAGSTFLSSLQTRGRVHQSK